MRARAAMIAAIMAYLLCQDHFIDAAIEKLYVSARGYPRGDYESPQLLQSNLVRFRRQTNRFAY